jgi:hypothetical protein
MEHVTRHVTRENLAILINWTQGFLLYTFYYSTNFIFDIFDYDIHHRQNTKS